MEDQDQADTFVRLVAPVAADFKIGGHASDCTKDTSAQFYSSEGIVSSVQVIN